MERNDRNTLILGILIILLLIVGFYFLLLAPIRERSAQLAEEREAREQQLAQLEGEVARLEEVGRNAPQIERELLEISKRIPTQPEVSTFVVQLEEIAEAAGVTQLSVQPGAPEPPPGGGDFQRIPITMTFEGNYEQLQDFMNRLLNLVRLVSVNEVVYEPVQQEGEDTVVEEVEELLAVEISAEIYFQPSDVPSGTEPVAPEPEPVPGGGTDAE